MPLRGLTVDSANNPRSSAGFDDPSRRVLDNAQVFHRISVSRPN
jgi:hypothetical protein